MFFVKTVAHRLRGVSLGILIGAAALGLPAAAQTRVRLDADFTLKLAATASVDGTALTVRFDKVGEDSRCPDGAQCIVSGDATVSLTATVRGSQPRHLELHTDLEPMTAEIPGFEIALVGLAPRPAVDRPVRDRDYVATLHITRVDTK
jgi:hypothetical protein